MLSFANSEKTTSNTFSLFINSGNGVNSTNVISNNSNLISNSVSLMTISDDGMDTCSFYSGPSDASIMAFGESSESCGSIAFGESSESCGSIAYSGGSESCGSIASSSVSTSSCGGGCSYSC